MSQKETLDLSDPWNRLQFAYENCNVKQYVEGHYAKYDDGKLSMCGIGWALHCAGYHDSELVPNFRCFVKTVTSNRTPVRALDEFGFSMKERKQKRSCPLPECTTCGSLQFVLEHINEAHKVPIPNIGKLIPIIRKQSVRRFTLADRALNLKRDMVNIVSARKNN